MKRRAFIALLGGRGRRVAACGARAAGDQERNHWFLDATSRFNASRTPDRMGGSQVIRERVIDDRTAGFWPTEWWAPWIIHQT
jgi:hypothetical protein